MRFLCRIVPPALIALVGITLLAFVFVSRSAWENQLKEIAASAIYMENWWLIKVGLDYLQRGADLSLVQHFWAVSLIGQVQLLWPLLLAFALWLARVWRRPAISVLMLILSATAIASLAYSIVATATHPDSAYFDLRTRYWEFAVGALVGLMPALRNNLPAAVANTLSWARYCTAGELRFFYWLDCAFSGLRRVMAHQRRRINPALRQRATPSQQRRLLARLATDIGSRQFGVRYLSLALAAAFNCDGRTPR